MTVVPFSVVGNWSTAGLISTTALPPSVSSLVILTVYFSPARRTSPLAGNSCRPSWREFAGAAVLKTRAPEASVTSTLTTEESSHWMSPARKAILRELTSTVDGRLMVSVTLAPSPRMLTLPA